MAIKYYGYNAMPTLHQVDGDDDDDDNNDNDDNKMSLHKKIEGN